MRKARAKAEMTAAAAAAKLGVTLGYIYVLCHERQLCARKMDRCWLISVESVERKLAARRRRERTLKRAAVELAELKRESELPSSATDPQLETLSA